jgi:hypothetical protein
MENWKAVKGYEGLYEVSDKGRVKGLKRNRILKNIVDSLGYVRVSLCKENKPKAHKIHRLVAEHFLKPSEYKVVNHIDGNKENNSVENLEWCNASQNRKHACDTGLAAKEEGRLIMCNETKEVYKGVMSAARHIGISHTMISSILNGGSGTAKGFTFSNTDSLNGQKYAIGEKLYCIKGEYKSKEEWCENYHVSKVYRDYEQVIRYEIHT